MLSSFGGDRVGFFTYKYMYILVEVSKISGIPSPLQIILTEKVLNSKELNLK